MAAPLDTSPADSIGRIFIEAARDLDRAAAAILAPPRELFVVEFFAEGHWQPLCGDAYIDADEARRVSERSSLETRIVRYVPERGEP